VLAVAANALAALRQRRGRLQVRAEHEKRAAFGRKPLPPGYPASRGPQENCVVDKLTQFEAELKNRAASICKVSWSIPAGSSGWTGDFKPFTV